jgi:hypothetical protein
MLEKNITTKEEEKEKKKKKKKHNKPLFSQKSITYI